MADSVTDTLVAPETCFPVLVNELLSFWLTVRAPIVAPLLQLAINVCLVMVTMLLVERVFMCGVTLFVKVMGRTPESVYKFQPIQDDVDSGTSKYPMVLVQIPMYNEREVYHLSIRAVCCLQWPADRIIVQVLDDSTDPSIKELVQSEVQRWCSKGINIKYETRGSREGFKAGAMREGMTHWYVRECEHVAVFDADFQPEPDFLMRSVPFLFQNPQIALVQARWKFVNGDECLMTRMQEVALNYHFVVEQQGGCAIYNFCNFNGTAGVWRICAMEEAGGWYDRTTVEDMDLALRTGLNGWKFVYLHNLEVKNELPSTLQAFRYQQHRWSCGPVNLFRKVVVAIVGNGRLTVWKRVHMLYAFFFVRKLVAHLVTFTFYCVVMPASALVPEVHVPLWGAVYVPSLIALLNVVTTPRSLHLLGVWILFENVMSLHRTKAALIGLLGVGNVNEWVVTQKLGNGLGNLVRVRSAKYMKKCGVAFSLQRFASNMLGKGCKLSGRVYVLELWTGGFLLFCASYNYYFQGLNCFFVYLFLQGCAFLVMGVGYVGTILS